MRSRLLESLSLIVWLAIWAYAAWTIPALPAVVPSHFGWNGAADRTGSRETLWFLPALSTLLYLGFAATRLVPQRRQNYPVKLTDQNREAVYALGREMQPAVKLCTMLTMLGTEWGSIDSAIRGSLSPLFTAAIFGPILVLAAVMIYYTIKMRAA